MRCCKYRLELRTPANVEYKVVGVTHGEVIGKALHMNELVKGKVMGEVRNRSRGRCWRGGTVKEYSGERACEGIKKEQSDKKPKSAVKVKRGWGAKRGQGEPSVTNALALGGI